MSKEAKKMPHHGGHECLYRIGRRGKNSKCDGRTRDKWVSWLGGLNWKQCSVTVLCCVQEKSRRKRYEDVRVQVQARVVCLSCITPSMTVSGFMASPKAQRIGCIEKAASELNAEVVVAGTPFVLPSTTQIDHGATNVSSQGVPK